MIQAALLPPCSAEPISASISGFAESARTCVIDGPKTCVARRRTSASWVPFVIVESR